MTTICVFVPIIFVDGMTRDIFTDLALTVAYSLLASLLIALTLVPAMARGLLKKETRLTVLSQTGRFMDKYRAAVRWALSHKAVVLIAAVVLLVGSSGLALMRGLSFMPSMSTPQISATSQMPKESTLKETSDTTDKIVKEIRKVDGVETTGAMLSSDTAGMMGMSGMSQDVTSTMVYIILDEDKADNGKIIAGIKSPDGSFLDSLKVFTAGAAGQHGANTTIGCILTNAKITKVQANRLADLAHVGLARAISPSHTNFDGDAYFALASNEKSIEFNILTALVPQLTERSIHAAVTGQSNLTQKKTDKLIFGIFQKMWK